LGDWSRPSRATLSRPPIKQASIKPARSSRRWCVDDPWILAAAAGFSDADLYPSVEIRCRDIGHQGAGKEAARSGEPGQLAI
jgi:hypothetical protein